MGSDDLAREHRIAVNIKWSGLLRLASIGINLMLVPVMLDFLGQSDYGIWLTISSFLGWSALLDLGIGHGLKNKLGEALAHDREEELKRYTSSAYLMIALVAAAAFLLFCMLTWTLDWGSILGVENGEGLHLRSVLVVFFLFFCMKIVLNQVITIASAKQNTRIGDVVNLMINGVTLLLLIGLVSYQGDRLLIVAGICGAIPVVVLFAVSLWAFTGPYREFMPSLKELSLMKGKEVIGLGSRFFIIQIAGIILFSTDNFIIAHFIGPEAVTPYHIAFRYFGLVVTLFSIVSIPIWPAYTEAYQKGDAAWIRKITGRLIRLWSVIVLVVLCMLLLAPLVYDFWVGTDVLIPAALSCMMALYVVTVSWGSIFVTFINSTGKLRIQLICSIIAGLVNIPLSIYLIEYTSLGSAGVMLATIICLSYGPVVSVIQYKKLINGTAKGIWAK